MTKNSKKGFTLIEILVVIGIIAILATIVLIAINPARQFAQARNSQRTSNLNAILNAIGQDIADNKGLTTCSDISTTKKNIGTGVGNANLAGCLVPNYLSAMLMDPDGGTAADTKYTVQEDGNGRIVVCAPGTDVPPASAEICITR